MTLLRGFATTWTFFLLNDYIWPPSEAAGDEYLQGTKLAILEMIVGHVFSTILWFQATRCGGRENGRARRNRMLFIEGPDGKVLERNLRSNAELFGRRASFSDRVMITFAPHAIYTVSGPTLRQVAEEAAETGSFIHIHASETRREVEECRAAHDGMTPIQWLDSLGKLGPKNILAHCVHLCDADIE